MTSQACRAEYIKAVLHRHAVQSRPRGMGLILNVPTEVLAGEEIDLKFALLAEQHWKKRCLAAFEKELEKL